jgi:hypothetical protein
MANASQIYNRDESRRWSSDLFCLVRDSSGSYGVVFPWADMLHFTIKRAFIVNDTLKIKDTLIDWEVRAGREQRGTYVNSQSGGKTHRNCDNEYAGSWKFNWIDYWEPYDHGVFSVSILIGNDGKRHIQTSCNQWCKIGSRLITTRISYDSVDSISICGWGTMGVAVQLQDYGNSLSEPNISIVMLAPNPTRGEISIAIESMQVAETQLELFDVMGESKWQSTVLPLKVGSNDFTIDTMGLPPGSYVLTAQTGKHVERRKLIILRR